MDGADRRRFRRLLTFFFSNWLFEQGLRLVDKGSQVFRLSFVVAVDSNLEEFRKVVPLADQVGHLFQFFKRLVRVAFDQDFEDLLNVVSDIELIVFVAGCAQYSVQVFLLLILPYQVCHDLADLDVFREDERILWDVTLLFF